MTDRRPQVDGCDECLVVGRCPRCERIVCWGHHANVESQIAVPADDLRARWRPDPLFGERCPGTPDPGQEWSG